MRHLAIAIVASSALTGLAFAGEHRFRVSPGSSSLLDASLSSPVAGTFVGNWDPAANPTGTRTMRGLFGGNTSTDNQTIDYTADLVASLVADRTPTGGFRLRTPSDGSGAFVHGLAFDLLADKPVDLTLSLDLVFASFRTRQPNSVFIGSSSFPPIPIPVGKVSALRIEQSGEAPAVISGIPGGGSGFTAMVPVNIVVQVSLIGQAGIDQVIPAMLPVSGLVDAGDGAPGASIVFDQGFGTALPDLPAFENQALGVPTILPPGGTANLLFSGQPDGAASKLAVQVALDLSLTDSPVPVDITGDGNVDGADLARILWNWGTADAACDLDEDGAVGGKDLAMVISCWGTPPG